MDDVTAWAHMIPWLPGEQWKEVPGFGGNYVVSNQGRVLSRPRRNSRGGILVGGLSGTPPNQRRAVVLWYNRTHHNRSVHRLVAAAFIGRCPDGMEVCHNDGDGFNNTADNLRYDTRRENTMDSVRHGTHHCLARTHCKHGHELTPENIYQEPGGPIRRRCRICLTASSLRKRQRARARRVAS